MAQKLLRDTDGQRHRPGIYDVTPRDSLLSSVNTIPVYRPNSAFSDIGPRVLIYFLMRCHYLESRKFLMKIQISSLYL